MNMRAFAFATVFVLLCAGVSGGDAAPWCASDCISLCKKTTSSPQACIESHQCTTKYPAAPCAGAAKVASHARRHDAGPKSFDQCLQRGVRAGWGTAET